MKVTANQIWALSRSRLERHIVHSGDRALLLEAFTTLNMGEQGTHGTGKTGKMEKKYSLSGKTQGVWKFCQNTGNLVCSSCKFLDPKSKKYFGICRENFHSFGGSG